MSEVTLPSGQEPDLSQSPAAKAREPPGAFAEFWFYFRENRGAVAGLAFLCVIIVGAVFASLITPCAPDQQFRDHLLQPPAWQTGGSWAFFLGTDDVGRDIASRLIFGARFSLFIGLVVVGLSLLGGILLGLVAGFSGRLIDNVIVRVMDVLLAFPSLLLALVLVAILGPGLFNAVLAVAVAYLPHFVRLTRASVIGERGRDYVTAVRVAGAGPFRIMFKTILPNCTAPLIVQAALFFSNAILDAAALGFLGMGAQPPTPEWGTMLAEARDFILRAWWTVTFPGLAILLTVLAINLVGDGLRDALDPRLKRS